MSSLVVLPGQTAIVDVSYVYLLGKGKVDWKLMDLFLALAISQALYKL